MDEIQDKKVLNIISKLNYMTDLIYLTVNTHSYLCIHIVRLNVQHVQFPTDHLEREILQKVINCV